MSWERHRVPGDPRDGHVEVGGPQDGTAHCCVISVLGTHWCLCGGLPVGTLLSFGALAPSEPGSLRGPRPGCSSDGQRPGAGPEGCPGCHSGLTCWWLLRSCCPFLSCSWGLGPGLALGAQNPQSRVLRAGVLRECGTGQFPAMAGPVQGPHCLRMSLKTPRRGATLGQQPGAVPGGQ